MCFAYEHLHLRHILRLPQHKTTLSRVNYSDLITPEIENGVEHDAPPYEDWRDADNTGARRVRSLWARNNCVELSLSI